MTDPRKLLVWTIAAITTGTWLGCSDESTGPSLTLLNQTSWARHGGGTSFDYGYDVVTDTSGNIYVTGEFNGDANIGPETFMSAGASDAFVAKFDKDGVIQWVKAFGGTGTDDANDVAIDAAGNLYITGQFTGTATFGAFNLVSAGSQDIYVAKLDPDGTVLWAQRAGGTSFESGVGLGCDAAGNVVVTGFYRGSFMIGSTTINAGGGNDVFIAGYDTNGNAVWAQQLHCTVGGTGYDVAFDNTGQAVVTGIFTGSCTPGGTLLTSAGSGDIFTAGINASGGVVWARRDGGTGSDLAYSIAADGMGNTWAAGYFVGAASFGAFNMSDAGGGDAYIAKYSSAGVVVGAYRFGGTDWESPRSIAVDTNNDIVVTGFIRGTSVWGATSLISHGRDDIFIAKFNIAGTVQWAWSTGVGGDDRGFGITTDSKRNIISTGICGDMVPFGNTTLPSNGATDFYVFKTKPTGP